MLILAAVASLAIPAMQFGAGEADASPVDHMKSYAGTKYLGTLNHVPAGPCGRSCYPRPVMKLRAGAKVKLTSEFAHRGNVTVRFGRATPDAYGRLGRAVTATRVDDWTWTFRVPRNLSSRANRIQATQDGRSLYPDYSARIRKLSSKRKVVVPNVVGLNATDARCALERRGLRWRQDGRLGPRDSRSCPSGDEEQVIQTHDVARQSPRGGTRVARGRVVEIDTCVSRGCA